MTPLARMVRTLGAAVLSVALAGLATSCSSGTQAYCDELAKKADLSALTSALDDKDLKRAAAAAHDFGELSDRAPQAIRVDMQAIAQSVLDMVDLIDKDREQARVQGDHAADTTEVDHLREQLNDRFDDLGRRSAKVSRWASENCGLDLS